MTREELTLARRLESHIIQLKKKLQSLKWLSTSLQKTLRETPSAKTFTSKVENIVAKVLDTERELELAEKHLTAAREHLLNEILTVLDDPVYQTL